MRLQGDGLLGVFKKLIVPFRTSAIVTKSVSTKSSREELPKWMRFEPQKEERGATKTLRGAGPSRARALYIYWITRVYHRWQ